MAVGTNGKLGTRERLLMQSEARWLQKALFALGKAKEDREKLRARLEGDVDIVEIELEGEALELATVRAAMKEAITERAEELRGNLYAHRAGAG